MGILLAKVAVADAVYIIDKPYTYRVPEPMREHIQPGMRLLIPFGRGNRRCEGMLLKLEEGEPKRGMKAVVAILDEAPVLGEEALKLALWMRERYFCTVYDAARAMLPTGLYFSIRERFKLAAGVDREAALNRAEARRDEYRILEMITASPAGAERSDIYAAFGAKSPFPALTWLLEQEMIVSETHSSRKTKDKSELMASLLLPPEEALALLEPKRKSAPMQYAVVELLAGLGSYSAKELCYFTGASMPTIRALEKAGMVKLEKYEVFRRVTVKEKRQAEEIVLNQEQQAASDGLIALMQEETPQAALLYGVTGSGKTQIYLSLIGEMLRQGKTAIMLVPEIALTPQMLQIFTAQFGDEIAVLHSSLRDTQRYDEWKRVKNGSAHVVIGTRSAVFAPLENIGLIILDEEQEHTYKSSEHTPRYHARDVAKFRVNHHGGLLLLGSATPSVESFYKAKRGIYKTFALSKRFNEQSLPQVTIADLRQELKAGNQGSLSEPLLQELEQNISRGEQSILFINRRGASRMVTCVDCGTVPECPNCSVKLTYHSANGRLMCHYCGHSEQLAAVCPSCGGQLTFLGTGTQRVEQELLERFPGLSVLRMDADTVTAKRSHEAILSEFERERIPVLLGTQMVAKGLDFPNVTLVGVVAADLSLYMDDFRAGERTFSLLTQVVGRAGRGEKTGRAVIQTMTPEHEVITCAAVQDYDRFYEKEIALRQLRGAPPYRDLFVLTLSSIDEQQVRQACLFLRQTAEQWLQQKPLEISLLGPAQATVYKINGRYRYRLTLSGRDDKPTRGLVAALLQLLAREPRYKSVHIIADCNPVD